MSNEVSVLPSIPMLKEIRNTLQVLHKLLPVQEELRYDELDYGIKLYIFLRLLHKRKESVDSFCMDEFFVWFIKNENAVLNEYSNMIKSDYKVVSLSREKTDWIGYCFKPQFRNEGIKQQFQKEFNVDIYWAPRAYEFMLNPLWDTVNVDFRLYKNAHSFRFRGRGKDIKLNFLHCEIINNSNIKYLELACMASLELNEITRIFCTARKIEELVVNRPDIKNDEEFDYSFMSYFNNADKICIMDKDNDKIRKLLNYTYELIENLDIYNPYPQCVDDISVISRFKNLKYLRILDVSRNTDLTPLLLLEKLEYVDLGFLASRELEEFVKENNLNIKVKLYRS